MTKLTFTDAFVSVDGNDISDHVTNVTLNYEAEAVECTAMGDDTRVNLAGLKNWTVDLDIQQDFASSDVDSILFALIGAAGVTLIIRPVNTGGVSSTNPNYTGPAILQSYSPMGGGVGDLLTTPASFVPALAGTLTREVA